MERRRRRESRDLDNMFAFAERVQGLLKDTSLSIHAKMLALQAEYEAARQHLRWEGELTPIVEERFTWLLDAAAEALTNLHTHVSIELTALSGEFQPQPTSLPVLVRYWWVKQKQ